MFVKEVAEHIRNFQSGDDDEITKVQEIVNQITEILDITLQKLVEETNIAQNLESQADHHRKGLEFASRGREEERVEPDH